MNKLIKTNFSMKISKTELFPLFLFLLFINNPNLIENKIFSFEEKIFLSYYTILYGILLINLPQIHQIYNTCLLFFRKA